MARGEYRPGAGRPPGSKNKVKQVLAEGERIAAEHGIVPLDYLLSVMIDEAQPLALRLYAAKAALPYSAPRPKAMQVSPAGEADDHDAWVARVAAELECEPQS
jgi:hypothetical protein